MVNTRILILLVCVSPVIGHGCSQPKVTESSVKTAERADLHNAGSGELPVHYETQAESLARILAESETAESRVDGAVRKEWYGSTLLGLGPIRRIIVPYVPAGNDSRPREITTPQIHKALTEYVLIDYGDSRSSRHIPMGTRVTIEYKDGRIGWINMYGGIPWDVSLQKDGSAGRYGLRETSEPPVAPEATAPPR